MIIEINPPFITLGQLLKFSGAAVSGDEAKQIILNGEVRVNGEVCVMRGKKIRENDAVSFGGKSYEIVFK